MKSVLGWFAKPGSAGSVACMKNENKKHENFQPTKIPTRSVLGYGEKFAVFIYLSTSTLPKPVILATLPLFKKNPTNPAM